MYVHICTIRRYNHARNENDQTQKKKKKKKKKKKPTASSRHPLPASLIHSLSYSISLSSSVVKDAVCPGACLGLLFLFLLVRNSQAGVIWPVCFDSDSKSSTTPMHTRCDTTSEGSNYGATTTLDLDHHLELHYNPQFNLHDEFQRIAPPHKKHQRCAAIRGLAGFGRTRSSGR